VFARIITSHSKRTVFVRIERGNLEMLFRTFRIFSRPKLKTMTNRVGQQKVCKKLEEHVERSKDLKIVKRIPLNYMHP
jgi:hypothetical protein